MKKSLKWLALVSLLLVVVMSFALISCGNKDNDTDTDTNANENTDSSADTTYTVTFKQDDGTAEKTTVKAGESIIPPAVKPVKGYTVAWEFTDFSNIASDLTVNVKKTPVEYKVTYVVGDGVNAAKNPTTYTIETEQALISASKKGYEFVAWYTDEAKTEKIESIVPGNTGDITLYAEFKIVDYKINYVLNDGVNNPGNPSAYNINSATITLQPANKTGFDFVGWYSDAAFTKEVKTINAGSTEDITLYAKYDYERFDIIYELDGGKNNKNNPDDFNEFESVTLEKPTKAGYKFDGWYLDAEFKQPTTGIVKGTKEVVTVYAKWAMETYTITYVLNDKGTNHASNPTEYNAATELPIMDATSTVEGVSFGGWYADAFFQGAQVKSTKGQTGNLTLYAKWEATSYDITYELNGGTNAENNPTSYTIENVNDVLTLADPTYLGCDFKGWYLNADFAGDPVTTIPAETIGGITLYAKWEFSVYNITYVLNQVGATNAETNVATYGRENDIVLANPIKDGVNFIGWYLEPEFTTKVENTNSLVGDVTFYAKWSKVVNLTADDITLDIQNGVQNGDIKSALLDGKTECSELYAWSNGVEWYNKNSNRKEESPGVLVDVVDSITITLNNPTDLTGIKFYGMGNWIEFVVRVYNSNGEEVMNAWSHNLNITGATGEFVVVSSDSGTIYKDVATITITCNTSGKIYRISEVVVEVTNPAYEEPAPEAPVE